MTRSTSLLRLAALAVLVAAGPAAAQVTPAEPFGGRPFGAPPGTPAPAPGGARGIGDTTSSTGGTMGSAGMAGGAAQQQPVVVTPQQPVIVSPQQPVVVAPQPQPQAQAQPMPVQQQAPAPAPAPMPNAVVGAPAQQQATPANGTGTARGTAAAQAPAAAAPAARPPVANVNRPAAVAPAAPAASGAQQAARGLPADAPQVVISGSVWSRDPARRRLIVNGQPVREGADLGQGLVVQEVRQASAVLGYKGAQYNVWY